MTQYVFETFYTPATYATPQAVPSLQAGRHATGFVLDSGDAVSRSANSLKDMLFHMDQK